MGLGTQHTDWSVDGQDDGLWLADGDTGGRYYLVSKIMGLSGFKQLPGGGGPGDWSRVKTQTKHQPELG